MPTTRTLTRGYPRLLHCAYTGVAALLALMACASTPKTATPPEPCTGMEGVVVQNNSGEPVEIFIVGGAGMSLGVVSSRAEFALPPRVGGRPWNFRAQTTSGRPVRLERSATRVTINVVCRR